METTVYCPRCGTLMERRFTEGRDREVCPACDYVFYRNPTPAVGVVVGVDGGVVLVRRKYEPRAGHWGLPAGFMELGESAEEAAARECHEETGLLVQIDHLLGVYSFGEGDQSGLVIFYAATAIGGVLAAGDDATDAAAFPLDALPTPLAFRTHLQAIERWRRLGVPLPGAPLLPDSPQPGIGLRYAGAADLPAALLLLCAERPDPAAQLIVDALLHDRLHDPDRAILVATQAGALAGVAVLSMHQTFGGWYATLDDLVVAPVHRRRGLGMLLIDAATQVARGRGCTTLHFIMEHGTEADTAFLMARGFAGGLVLTRRLAEP